MKSKRTCSTVTAFLLTGFAVCEATPIPVDSFSEGEFYFEGEISARVQESISSPLVDSRIMSAVGLGTWSVRLVPGSGFLAYEATEYVPSGRGFSVALHYTRSGSLWSIEEYDAIELDFVSVTGSGLLQISVSTSDMDNVVEVPVTSPGILRYPVSYLAASSLNDITAMDIRLSPDGGNFSFHLNQIGVVPEPSSCLLLGASFLLLGLFRWRM
jgi:hypothetical protein